MGLGLLGSALAGAVVGAGNIANEDIKQANAAALEKARSDAEMKLRETINGWEEGRFKQTFDLEKSKAEAEAADRAAQAEINQTRLANEGAYQQSSLANQAAELGIRRAEAGKSNPQDTLANKKVEEITAQADWAETTTNLDPSSPEYAKAMDYGKLRGWYSPKSDDKSFTETINPDGTKSRTYGTPASGQGGTVKNYTGDPELKDRSAARARQQAADEQAAAEAKAANDARLKDIAKTDPTLAEAEDNRAAKAAKEAAASQAKRDAPMKGLLSQRAALKKAIDSTKGDSTLDPAIRKNLLDEYRMIAQKIIELEGASPQK